MQTDSRSPIPPNHTPVLSEAEGLPAIPTVPTTRHDGWTGDKMAAFCETLAETAVVIEACDMAGMSVGGAYAARRRNPIFAAAWDAALTIARERLADTLLARAMEGNLEQIWRDGVIVGERHVLDNRLGLALLRRLDRLAETGLAVHNLSPSSVRPQPGQLLPSAPPAIDWDEALNALRSGDPDAIAAALASLKGNEVDEVHGPPISLSQGDNARDDEDDGIDLSDRIWRDENNDIWLTDFPPPPGFDSYQQEAYGEDNYERACTPEEVAAIVASEAADAAEALAEDEDERDAWFELLRTECSAADAERPRSSTKSRAEPASGSPSGEPD